MINIFKRLRELEDRVDLHEDYLETDSYRIRHLFKRTEGTLASLESYARYTSTVPLENKAGEYTRKKVTKKKLEEHLAQTEPVVTNGSTEDY